MPIAQQISLVVALICMLGLSGLALFSARVSRQEMSGHVRADMERVAASLSGQLERDLNERLSDIRQLADMQPLTPAWESGVSSLRSVLSQLQRMMPVYAWIGFARPSGIVVAASQGLLEGEDVNHRPWFSEGMKGLFVGDVNVAPALEKLLPPRPDGALHRFVDVSFPVHSSEDHLLGVLGAHLSFAWADAARRRALDDEPGLELWIVGADGTILSGRDGGPSPFGPEQMARFRAENSGTFEETDGDATILVGFSRIDSDPKIAALGWVVVARQDAAIAFGGANRIAASILGIGALVLLVSISLALGLTRLLSRPLKQLTIAAQAIGRDPSVTMLPRVSGSLDVLHLSGALRALLRRLDIAEHRFLTTQQAHKEEVEALRQLADTDPLTGLLNRRSFLSMAEGALQGTRSTDSLGILMADIDHFKAVNDTYGHAAGDAVIRYVAATIGANLRVQDRVARFGGEEFVALLMNVDEAGTLALAERIRSSINAQAVRFEGQDIRVSISIGVAIADPSDGDLDAIIERADFALYDAKTSGRNKVALARRPSRAS
ncbi:sensor domain-containing diguanylate cyclase [Aquabacter sp. P-9]|uniref:sensor domain-containing diguanylate cyclase n=1 Tax=Aquabacter sediminis TaxID=3029197 RepID=UPI00237EE3CC|nr:sensor domain-containing diguanylate cyclase [Aquabacter sp. P-9]MDE1568091.1 sensor domain-containing diguanylate cyclase [Aquabacter sp. P-9]